MSLVGYARLYPMYISQPRPIVSHLYQPDKVRLSSYRLAIGCEHSVCSKNITINLREITSVKGSKNIVK